MITGYIVGDRQLIARLQRCAPAIADRVASTVDQLGVDLARHVVQDFLSGQVLKRRTGLLATSITRGAPETRSRFAQEGTKAISYVGSNVAYAHFWEYGFHGLVAVKPYLRHSFKYKMKDVDLTKYNIGAGMVRARVRTNEVIGYAWVNGFFRNVDQAPRAYLKPALEAFKPTITAAIQKAAREAVQKTLKT